MKRETKLVLEELSAVRIRSVMVTGNNIQTALTVAKKCWDNLSNEQSDS